MRLRPRRDEALLVMRKVPSPRLRMAGSTSLATRNGPRPAMCCAVSNISTGCAPAAPCPGQIASLEIAGVVDHHVEVADTLADRGKRPGDGVLPYEVHLDRHALAVLRLDGLRQRRRIA